MGFKGFPLNSPVRSGRNTRCLLIGSSCGVDLTDFKAEFSFIGYNLSACQERITVYCGWAFTGKGINV